MKGITPVVAIVLLLLVTIAVVGFAYTFLSRTAETSGEETKKQLENQLSNIAMQVKIESATINRLTIRNIGSQSIPAGQISVFVDGTLQSCAFGDIGSQNAATCSTGFACNGQNVKVTAPGNTDEANCPQPAAFQGILYGIADGTPAELYIINAGAGNVQNVGTLSVSDGDFGLAFNSHNGLFYAVGGNAAIVTPPYNLLSVNPSTGSSQVVGPLGAPGAGPDPGLAYDENTGTLWLVSDSESFGSVPLHSVDITTGQATFIGNLDTVSWGNSNMGLAFDPATNTLYAVSVTQGLVSVNTATGAATNICTPWGSSLPVGLAFHRTENLLYTVEVEQPTVPTIVYTLDPAGQTPGSPCIVTWFADITSLPNLEGIDFR